METRIVRQADLDLVTFLSHMDKLPPAVKEKWQRHSHYSPTVPTRALAARMRQTNKGATVDVSVRDTKIGDQFIFEDFDNLRAKDSSFGEQCTALPDMRAKILF